MMKKVADILAGLIGFFFLFGIIRLLSRQIPQISPIYFRYMGLSGIFFILVHIIKYVRLYLILNESHVNLGAFFLIYLKGVMVNILIPFKIGEVYKFYVIGNYIKNYKCSFLSIITERFFDTIIVLIALIINIVFYMGNLDFAIAVFAFFVISCILLYNTFEPTYKYLNKFFVTKQSSKKDTIALRALDICNDWFIQQKKISANKGVLVFFLSTAAWICEYLALSLMFYSCGYRFAFSDFSLYISSFVMLGYDSNSIIFTLYLLFSLTIIVLLACVFMPYVKIKKKDNYTLGKG